MLHSNIWFGLLILYGTMAEDIVPHSRLRYILPATNETSRTGRFGFSILNEIRQYFCRSSCTSADTMPYIINIMCAAKCPELYLPHGTTTSADTIMLITMSTLASLPVTSPSGSEQTPTGSSSTTTFLTTPSSNTMSTTAPSSNTMSTTISSSTPMSTIASSSSTMSTTMSTTTSTTPNPSPKP